jgi:protein-disulfide isomerase
MATQRIARLVDVAAAFAMLVAASLVIWQAWPGGSAQPPPSPPPATENIEEQGLSMSLMDAFSEGDSSAPIVLIEFADFECPFCARYHRQTFQQIQENYVLAGTLGYVFRNLPLDRLHPSATAAATAASCVGRQGLFWDMRARLFARQGELSQLVWSDEAHAIGADRATFDACFTDPNATSMIRQDVDEATRLGVTSTPTFFLARRTGEQTVLLVTRINGARPFEIFAQAIKAIQEAQY